MLSISDLEMIESIYFRYGTIPEDCVIFMCGDQYEVTSDRHKIHCELRDKLRNKYLKTNQYLNVNNNLFQDLGGDLECTNVQNIDECLRKIDNTMKEFWLHECLDNLNQFDNVLVAK